MSAKKFAAAGQEDNPVIIDSDDSDDDYISGGSAHQRSQHKIKPLSAKCNTSRPKTETNSKQPSNTQSSDSIRSPTSTVDSTSASRQSFSARKRHATSQNDPPKRPKKSVEDDLKCPLSLELPVDPVMAMDNRVYERAQIEMYFKGKASAQVKSPMTGKKMGKTLRPAIQHRNTIETLIETGAITGEMAETWKKGLEGLEQRAQLLEKASKGDVDAMVQVANNFHEGENGFAEDCEAAFEWFEKASSKGSVIAMAELGDMLVVGDGVPQDEPHGLVKLGIAAGKGSDLAAFALGMYYADGDHGLPEDKDAAIEFLQVALSDKCVHRCMNAKAKLNAEKKLEKLLNGWDDDDEEEDEEDDEYIIVFEGEESDDFLDDGDY